MAEPLPIAVFISGGGTTLRNLLQEWRAGQLPVEFRLVVSSNPRAGGLEFAREAGIPTEIVRRRDFASGEAHADAVFGACRRAGVALAVMAGYLEFVLIPADFENRVVNIHPSLIPAFCGHGFYGRHVHEAVLAYGAKVSGCTVHFVDNQYDHGPIILQRTVAVADADTPESLARRVFEAECAALPAALRAIAAGDIEVVGRVVRKKGEG